MPAYSNASTIWRGFNHNWGYNHRVNRMGDWIQDISYENGYKARSFHSAASGIGADRCKYNTYLTGIKTSPDFHFADVSNESVLAAKEETIVNSTITLSATFPKINQPHAIVLLNGFDMYSRVSGENLLGDGASDKLFHFGIQPKNIIINSDGDNTVVEFDVDLSLGGACASLECSSGANNDYFDYMLKSYYQVIVADESKFATTNKTLNNSYSWAKPNGGQNNEIEAADYAQNEVSIQGESDFNIGLCGISSFLFKTEKGFGGFGGNSFEYPHMLAFNMAIDNLNYSPSDGTMQLDAALFFKNWQKPIPFISFGSAGSVDFSMDVELLQFKDKWATYKNYQLKDEIEWWTTPFDPAPPNTEGGERYIFIDVL